MKQIFTIAVAVFAFVSLLGISNAQDNPPAAPQVAQSASPAMPEKVPAFQDISKPLGLWEGTVGGEIPPQYLHVELVIFALSPENAKDSIALFGWKGFRSRDTVYPAVTWQGSRPVFSFETRYGHRIVLTLMEPGWLSGTIVWPGIPSPYPINFKQK